MGRQLLQLVLIASGTLCVALGVLGIFLPLLPTTVFLLLAAMCYARSSDRFYQKLVNHRWLGVYIRNYREGRGMSRREKLVTLGLLWIGIGATMTWTATEWWMRAGLIAIAIGVTAHVARLKARRAVALGDVADNSAA
jgi:uncharacterized membrane protein YbaN (DUF454 family)